MLLDIIMESLASMDDETLDYALESMSEEELEIVNNYVANATGAVESADDTSDDAYVDALEAAVYELNSMSDEDVIAVLESLDDETVEDLIAMEGIISGAAKLAGKVSGSAVGAGKAIAAGAKKSADAVKSGASDLAGRASLGAAKAKDALTNKLNEAKLIAYQQTPTFRKGAAMADAAVKNAGRAIKNEVDTDVATAKYAVKKGINALKADAANAKDAFKSAYNSKANESADIITSIRDKILAQCE